MSYFTRAKLAYLAETEAAKAIAWPAASKYTKDFEPVFGANRFEWCGAFTHWCVQEAAGIPVPISFKDNFGFTWALVEGIQQWAKEKQLYIDNAAGVIPNVGDIVIFDWKQTDINQEDIDWDSHVGIFLRMDGDKYICAEGNSGDVTGIHSRPGICIQGFIRIPDNYNFDASISAPTVPATDSFAKALAFTFEREGIYSDHPLDGGGKTMWGVTEKEWCEWFNVPSMSREELQAQPKSEAAKIYEEKYWLPLGCDEMKDETLALILFDQGVNCGIYGAAAMLQKMLGVTVDKVIGPISIEAANKMSALVLCYNFFRKAQAHYVSIAQNNPSQGVFLLGWINRSHFYLDEFVKRKWLGESEVSTLKKLQLGYVQAYLAGGSVIDLIESFN